MSGRSVARYLRERAAEARAASNSRGIDELRMRRFREYLRSADNGALVAWLEQRLAQDLEAVAAECERRITGEVTTLEKPRRR